MRAANARMADTLSRIRGMLSGHTWNLVGIREERPLLEMLDEVLRDLSLRERMENIPAKILDTLSAATSEREARWERRFDQLLDTMNRDDNA
jgi:hypothetical protein